MPRVRFNKLPITNRAGAVVGHALVDPEDYLRFHGRRLSLQAGGYVQSWDGKKVRTLHRMILGLEVGDPRHADHVNGNKLDNRRQNLRAGDQALNKQNYHHAQKNNSTGVLYVHRSRDKYEVRLGGARYGRFDSLEAATAEAAFRTAERAELLRDAYQAAV